LVNCDTYALLYLFALFASFVRVRLNSLWDPMIVRKNARPISISSEEELVQSPRLDFRT
jgi:hypothetical protein